MGGYHDFDFEAIQENLVSFVDSISFSAWDAKVFGATGLQLATHGLIWNIYVLPVSKRPRSLGLASVVEECGYLYFDPDIGRNLTATGCSV